MFFLCKKNKVFSNLVIHYIKNQEYNGLYLKH